VAWLHSKPCLFGISVAIEEAAFLPILPRVGWRMSSMIEDYLLLGSQVIDGKEQTRTYVIGGLRRFVKSWKVREISKQEES